MHLNYEQALRVSRAEIGLLSPFTLEIETVVWKKLTCIYLFFIESFPASRLHKNRNTTDS